MTIESPHESNEPKASHLSDQAVRLPLANRRAASLHVTREAGSLTGEKHLGNCIDKWWRLVRQASAHDLNKRVRHPIDIFPGKALVDR